MAVSLQNLGLSLLVLLAISGHAHGFGAGNIASLSRIEGQNWRHGDIEDTLLTLFLARVAGGRKFGKLDVKRVYFGNWLRDYSQAVDVGTVKYVSAEAIRILIWVLGFMSFGFGTREFEVTSERLGCYQPTEHIDNPQGYAEGEDARRYDSRLRGPVDEERELSVDPRTGLKSYIASEDIGIDTSAGLIRCVLGRSIQLGRRYAQSRNNEDLYEALRLLGTGLHCLEDYAAHSNYTELSLIELGETEVFPHVGCNTRLEVGGARDYIYPVVTGTFGGVDFFHSVLGEFSDKTMQSEIQSLEGVIDESQGESPSESFLQDLLGKIPDGLIGDSDAQAGRMDDFKAKADDAKSSGQHISPREPEEWALYLNDVQKQIYPVLEWHDELLKAIHEAIEKIPVLPELIEQIQDQITIFVFSILAPYVLPIIKQVKAELETGSSEVIQSSREQQHIVFNDDDSSNPTHSMLSKDHFSNVLNEPAGRIASNIVKWAVPQLMQCWDDEYVDVNRTLNRIISGVFHHPALRDYGDDGAVDMRQTMFSTVEQWWQEKGEEGRDVLREQLSRDGVLEGKNHKEGVRDSGHGCGKPLALPKGHGNSGGIQEASDTGLHQVTSDAVGGGALGGLVGGIVGGMSSMLLNEASSKPGRESPESQYESGDLDDREHEHRHRHHHEGHGRCEENPYENMPPPRRDYEYRSEPAAYGSPPVPRDDYPQTQNYRREEYQQYQPEHNGGGYYEHERRETYQTGYSEYERTESRYDYGPGHPSYGHTEQSAYGRGGFEQDVSPGCHEPRGGYDEYGSSGYGAPREEYGQRVDNNTEYYAERRHEHDQRSRDSGSRSGDSDEEHSHHHRHHRHRHHRHHHHDRSGSENSD